MKKFSKLNESVRIDQSKLETILSELEGVKYKVFDYFFSNNSFIEDISRIKSGAKNAKIIIIRPKFEIESFEIEGWSENFKLNSSGFYFFKNSSEAKNHFDQAFSLLEKLKEYSPSLCIRDGRFIIYLVGDELSQGDLEVQQDLEKAYDKLYHLLDDFSKNNFKKIKNVTFWREWKKLTAELKGDDEKMLTTLASLCPHMVNKSSGYSWMSSQPKDEELENISDIINQMGFIIEFVGPKYSDDVRNSKYTFKLVEI
jgi:hypothetical protein